MNGRPRNRRASSPIVRGSSLFLHDVATGSSREAPHRVVWRGNEQAVRRAAGEQTRSTIELAAITATVERHAAAVVEYGTTVAGLTLYESLRCLATPDVGSLISE